MRPIPILRSRGSRRRNPVRLSRPAWGVLAAVALTAAAAAAANWSIRSTDVAGPLSSGAGLFALSSLASFDPRASLVSRREWLNTRPLTAEDLRGKVVLVNFWTYTCINSLRPLPYLRDWRRKYGDRGLVVIGVHTPEFGFEKDIANVRRAVADLGVDFPVVLDSDSGVWNAYGNSAWPGFYFIDRNGRVARRVLGEGGYDRSEGLIQSLLEQGAGSPVVDDPIRPVEGKGVELAADWDQLGTGETYVGYGRAVGFASEGGLRRDRLASYEEPRRLGLNRWALAGEWKAGHESAALVGERGSIAFRFHARDLHLVMAPPPSGERVRFRVTLDGSPPGPDHGVDTDAQGWGQLDNPRMYQLVRQSGRIADQTFRIEFIGPGVSAFAFTFG